MSAQALRYAQSHTSSQADCRVAESASENCKKLFKEASQIHARVTGASVPNEDLELVQEKAKYIVDNSKKEEYIANKQVGERRGIRLIGRRLSAINRNVRRKFAPTNLCCLRLTGEGMPRACRSSINKKRFSVLCKA